MKLTAIGHSGSISGRFSAVSAYPFQIDGGDENDRLRAYPTALDLDPGAIDRSLNYFDPADLDAVVLSHLRIDRCAGIIGMQAYRRWFPGGSLARTPIYSSSNGQRRTRQLSEDPDEEIYEGEFEFKQIGPGDVAEVGPMKPEAFIADYTVPHVGLRVSEPDDLGPDKVALGYTGNTDLCNTEVEVTRGADLLFSEYVFEDRRDSVRGVHMTGSRAGEFTQRAGATRLLLTHLRPWTDPEAVRRSTERVYEDPMRAVLLGEEHRV